MSQVSEYANYLFEQFEALSGLQMKRMFGGVCFTQYGLAFAIMPNSELYFVTDDTTRPHYEHYGMSCFAYDTKKGRVQVKRYFAVPEQVLADSDLLLAWAKVAIQAARNTPAKSSKRKPN